MKKVIPFRLALAGLLTLFFTKGDAQTWTRTFGGSKNEAANQIIQTSDGGYLIAGNSDSYSNKQNIYLLKTNQHGVMQWQKTIFSNYYESAIGLTLTDAGSIFLIANSTDSIAYKKILLIKLDLSGNVLFSQNISGNLTETASGIVNAGNDLVVSGTVNNLSTGEDIFTLKLDSLGTPIWRKEINIPNTQRNNAIKKKGNGGFLIAGVTVVGNSDFEYAVSLNSIGDTLWTRQTNYGYNLGGFISCATLAGDSIHIFSNNNTSTNSKNIQFVAYTSSGNFSRHYFNFSESGLIYDILPDTSGGFVVAGKLAQFLFTAHFSSWNSEIRWIRTQLAHKSATLSAKYTSIIGSGNKFILAGNSNMFGYYDGIKGTNIFIQSLHNDGGMDAMDPVSIVSDTAVFCYGDTTTLSVSPNFDYYQWIKYDSKKARSSWVPGVNSFALPVDSGGDFYCTLWNDDYYAFASRTYNNRVPCYGKPDTTIKNTGKLIHCILMGTIKLYVAEASNTTYQWYYNGVAIPGSNKHEHIPLVTGNYAVQVTNPCFSLTSSGTFVDVTNGPIVEVYLDTLYGLYDSRSGIACNILLSGGILGTSCQWYKDGQFLGLTTPYIHANAPGTYWVDRTSPCGVNRGVYTVIYDTLTATLKAHGQLTGCFTAYTMLSVNKIGYYHEWYRNGVLLNTATTDTIILLRDFGSGLYHCKIYNGGCQYIFSDTINYQYNVAGNFSIDYGITAVSCGAPKTLTARFNTASFYQWYLDGIAILNANSVSYNATQSGTYHYVALAACGTGASLPVKIQFGPPATFTTTILPDRPVIYRVADTLSVQISYEYPPPGTSIQWKLDGQNTSFWSNTNLKLGGLYECYLTNACGTTLASSIQVGTYVENNVLSIIGDTILCQGDSVILELPNSINGSYYWNKSGFSISGAISKQLIVKESGIYYGTYRTLFGPVATVAVKVVVNPKLFTDIYHSAPLSICSNPTVELSAPVRNDFSYQWYSNGFVIPGAINNNFFASLSGSYTVSIIDSNNCESILGNANVKDSVLTNITLALDGPNIICQGEAKTIKAPAGFISYQWFADNTIIPGATDDSLVVNMPGHYKVELLDNNGCKRTGRIYIRQFMPIGSTFKVQPVLCNYNGSFQRRFDEPVDVIVTGPNGFYLSRNQVTIIGSSNLPAGNYIFKYGPPNTSSCFQLDTLDLQVEPFSPVIGLIYSNQNACSNKIVGLALESPSSIGYTLWSTGATTSSIAVYSSGYYSVTQSNLSGTCSGTDSIYVEINQAPSVSISVAGNPNFCLGNSVTLDAGSGHASYHWNTGATTQTILAPVGGKYIVIVQDSINSCTATDTVFVNVLNGVALNIAATDTVNVCQGEMIFPVQYQTGMTYLWSNGQTTPAMIPAGPGWYTLTAFNPNGCNVVDSVFINIVNPAIPNITAAGPTTFCQGQSVSLNAGVIASQYLWSTGETSQSISVSVSGWYWVSVTNGGSCANKDSIQVMVNSNPAVNISPGTTIDACQGQTVLLSVTPTLGHSFLWSTGETTSQILLNSSANLDVTVTNNANGCSTMANASVTFYALPIVSITAAGPTSFCQGDSVLINALSSGTNFIWLRNNVPIPGANSSAFIAKIKGTYKCVASDVNGCLAISTGLKVSVPCVPIGGDVWKETTDELFFDDKFLTIFPNPASDLIFISTTLANFDLRIYASDGKLIRDLQNQNGENAIDISMLPDAIYYLIATDDQGKMSSAKFLKKSD